MKLLDQLRSKISLFTGNGRKTPVRRTYSAAQINRLTQGWVFSPLTEDAEIRKSLRTLRARSRDLAHNESTAKKFFSMLKSNVVGPNGIKLQNKALNKEGVLDTAVNKKIEEAFCEWCKKENASVEKDMSFKDLQNLVLESEARDGEVLVRLVKGYDNDFKFALQVIEADHLDENYNEDLANGNRIVMGIEKDVWRKPVAYHLLTTHPGDYSYYSAARKQLYNRIPAEEIIHLFIRKRPTQSRGVPWMHTAMFDMNMSRGYKEAELVAARASACKMGFFTSKTGGEYTGDGKNENGDLITDAEAGTFEELPDGVDFKPYDPQHPSGNFQPFIKAILRGVASGLDVSYNSLASDLEGVNYSSIRQGTLDERDYYKSIQSWLIEHFCADVYKHWIDMAILTGKLSVPATDVEKVSKPYWQPRGFAWIDPEKDQDANAKAVRAGFKTSTMVVAEQGYDITDIYDQLAREEELRKLKGIEVDFSGSKNSDQKQSQNQDTTEKPEVYT